MPCDTKLPMWVSPMTSGVNGFSLIGAVGLRLWPNSYSRHCRSARITSGMQCGRGNGEPPQPRVQRRGQAQPHQQPDADREHRRLERRRLDWRHADVVVENVNSLQVARHAGSERVQAEALADTAARSIVISRAAAACSRATRPAAASADPDANRAWRSHSPLSFVSRSPIDRMTRPLMSCGRAIGGAGIAIGEHAAAHGRANRRRCDEGRPRGRRSTGRHPHRAPDAERAALRSAPRRAGIRCRRTPARRRPAPGRPRHRAAR